MTCNKVNKIKHQIKLFSKVVISYCYTYHFHYRHHHHNTSSLAFSRNINNSDTSLRNFWRVRSKDTKNVI